MILTNSRFAIWKVGGRCGCCCCWWKWQSFGLAGRMEKPLMSASLPYFAAAAAVRQIWNLMACSSPALFFQIEFLFPLPKRKPLYTKEMMGPHHSVNIITRPPCLPACQPACLPITSLRAAPERQHRRLQSFANHSC